MNDRDLRSRLIRLAYNKPETREDLLPLLTREAARRRRISPVDREEIIDDFVANLLRETNKRRSLGRASVSEGSWQTMVEWHDTASPTGEFAYVHVQLDRNNDPVAVVQGQEILDPKLAAAVLADWAASLA